MSKYERSIHVAQWGQRPARLEPLIGVPRSFAGRDGVECFIWSMMEAWKDKSVLPALAESAQLRASGQFNWASTNIVYSRHRHHFKLRLVRRGHFSSLRKLSLCGVDVYLAEKIPTLVLFYNVKQNKTKCSQNFSFLCLLVILRRKKTELFQKCWSDGILLRFKKIIIPLEYGIHSAEISRPISSSKVLTFY
jgi:hypothetical protein